MPSNGVAANLLMFAILGAGLVSLTGLEREAWPSVPFNHIEVSMAYPGATPEEVEESIVVKIEEQVSSLDDVLAVKSVAAPGMASVRIEVPLFRLRAWGSRLTTSRTRYAAARSTCPPAASIPGNPRCACAPSGSATISTISRRSSS